MVKYKIKEEEIVKRYKEIVKALLMTKDIGNNVQLGKNCKPLEEGLSAEDIAKIYSIDISIAKKILSSLEKDGVVEKHG